MVVTLFMTSEIMPILGSFTETQTDNENKTFFIFALPLYHEIFQGNSQKVSPPPKKKNI